MAFHDRCRVCTQNSELLDSREQENRRRSSREREGEKQEEKMRKRGKRKEKQEKRREREEGEREKENNLPHQYSGNTHSNHEHVPEKKKKTQKQISHRKI